MKNLKDFGFSNYSITKSGEVFSSLSNRFLKKQDKGYEMINLLHDSGKKINTYVHRLVAMAYCDGYSLEKHVNHIDGDKTNNNYWNLEWVTRSENMIHAWQNNLISTECADPKVVHKICDLLEQGFKASDVSRILNVSIDLPQDVLQGKSWVWISEEYNFKNTPRKNRLNPEKVLRICEMLQEGTPIRDIAKKINTSFYNVKNIKSGRTFKDISANFQW